MPIVTADSYGIDYTGATDVGAALANAINANSGNTFQLHPNGRYLLNTNINSYGTIWTAGNIVIEGQDAALFRNVKRDNGYAPHYNMVTIYGNAGPVTVSDLHLYGYRKDPYPGNELTTVAGTPTPSGATVQLDAVNEEVRLPQVPLDWVQFSGEPNAQFHNWETPFYFRDPDGYVQFDFFLFSSVALDTNGAVLSIINDETGAVLHSSTVSPTLVPTTYTLRWLLPEAHLGTRLRVTVRKATGGNTLTVQSITAYGECGYRNKNATGTDHNGNPSPLYSDGNHALKGGNEFSDLLVPATITGNMTLDNVSTEGSDGDGINLSSMGGGGTLTLTNFFSRGAGRQGITNPNPTCVIRDSVVRETGRAGIDFEPVGGAVGSISLERVDFINTRNYTVAAANYGVVSDVHFTDCTSTNAGMGPWYGGGWWITIDNFTHSNTYRLEADRVLNGGRAGVDAIIRGFNITADGFTTDIGFWLAAGDNIVITGAQADNEPAIIDATNSSVDFAPPVTGGTWDSSEVIWDDPVVSWDSAGAVITLPAFQNDFVQNDAFQADVLVVVEGALTQTFPPFTQTATGFAGYSATIAQTLGAFTQSGDVTVSVTSVSLQTLGAFTQSGTMDMTVRGFIGSRVTTFQEDAFQEDAFQTAPDVAHVMPAFTQSLVGSIVPHDTVGGRIDQAVPGFTQAADAGLEITIVIAQSIPAITQAGTIEQPTAGAMTQTAPGFQQAAVGTVTVNAFVTIHQVIPAFTQSLQASIIRWDEWPVGSGEEWLVGSGEEWLVRQP